MKLAKRVQLKPTGLLEDLCIKSRNPYNVANWYVRQDFFNHITRIEGLEKLQELITLDLRFNKITRVEGLQNHAKLSVLCLEENPITEPEGWKKWSASMNWDKTFSRLGDAQAAVMYCKEKQN